MPITADETVPCPDAIAADTDGAGVPSSSSKSPAMLVYQLLEVLADLDAIGAHVAGAYVDSAVQTLCRDHSLPRITVKPD